MAHAVGLSHTTVSRMWRAFGLQPHRSKTFKLSPDPWLVDKVRDIVGLYVDPSAHAVVRCVDEEPQIQALDRTGAAVADAAGPNRTAHTTTRRHGTTTLFAALEREDRQGHRRPASPVSGGRVLAVPQAD